MILFYSYSHKDEKLRNELEAHLAILKSEGVIQSWHDRKITPGSDWSEAIDASLEAADIILLLISADFLASDYCYGREARRALERYRSKTASVVPIILRACDWKSSPIGALEALPKDAKPVKSWSDRDKAWTDVAQGVRRVAGQIARRAERQLSGSSGATLENPPATGSPSAPHSAESTAFPRHEELSKSSWERLWPGWFGAAAMITLIAVLLSLKPEARDTFRRIFADVAGMRLVFPVFLVATSFACGSLFSADYRLNRLLRFLGGATVPVLFYLVAWIIIQNG